MAEIAVFASGNGSNFEALVRGLEGSDHRVCCLICDRKKAYVFERAEGLSIPAHYIPGWNTNRTEAEERALEVLERYTPDLIVLAGFMRILSPRFLEHWENPVVNIHPSLLPKYPGAHGIAESYASGDPEVGITIHLVDRGTDTGPVLLQKSVRRLPSDTVETVEKKIHELEHYWYPRTVRKLLDETKKAGAVD